MLRFTSVIAVLGVAAVSLANGFAGTWIGGVVATRKPGVTIPPDERARLEKNLSKLAPLKLKLELLPNGRFKASYIDAPETSVPQHYEGMWVQSGRDIQLKTYIERTRSYKNELMYVDYGKKELRLQVPMAEHAPIKCEFVLKKKASK